MPRNCDESCVYFSIEVGCDIGVLQNYDDDTDCEEYFNRVDAESLARDIDEEIRMERAMEVLDET